MTRSYTRKLTISFCSILAVFSVGLVVFEQYKEKHNRTEAMEEQLNGYADIVNRYVALHPDDPYSVPESLLALLPDNLRLTLIDANGDVLFDNQLDEAARQGNHANRPEIVEARQSGKGSDIRKSVSNSREYLYYTLYRNGFYTRVALPYDIRVKHSLEPDDGFIYYSLALLLLGTVFIYYVSGRFGKTIKQLRDFSYAVNRKGADTDIPDFPDNEIGEIGAQIANEYKRLKESEIKLALEREKLLQHVQSSAEGICFFTPDMQVAFYNGLFLQYLDIIGDQPVVEPLKGFADPVFREMYDTAASQKDKKRFETQISRQGKIFVARVTIFDDGSFEIVLNDITRQEKTRRLKQEMTGNIAHEIRTPVTVVRGYLETALEKTADRNIAWDFVRKAYQRVQTLSELIHNMSLLARMDEATDSFRFHPVDIAALIRKVETDMDIRLKSNGITIQSNIPDGFQVQGNDGLLYVVFRNLIDNVVNYAGEGVLVSINLYNKKDGYAWFSFSDNGTGIRDEAHFGRLFERFYRINEGRSRDTGGSGLGLSIVKNAIVIHGGTITVKNRKGGGLEYLFRLIMT